jgi:hypothetical protein
MNVEHAARELLTMLRHQTVHQEDKTFLKLTGPSAREQYYALVKLRNELNKFLQ